MKKEISWFPIIIVAIVLIFVYFERRMILPTDRSNNAVTSDVEKSLRLSSKLHSDALEKYKQDNTKYLEQIQKENEVTLAKLNQLNEEIKKKKEDAEKDDEKEYNASTADVYKDEPRKVEIFYGDKLVSTLMSSKSLSISGDCKELAVSTTDKNSIKNFFCPGGYRVVLHSRLK